MTERHLAKNDEGKALEGMASETRDRLRLIPSGRDESPTENIAADPYELEEVCSLSVSEDEIRHKQVQLSQMGQEDPERFHLLLNILIERNYDKVLPIQEKSFNYQRYVQECERLKKSLGRLRTELRQKGTGPKRAQELSRNLSGDMAHLLVLQSRANDWLERSYFPALFEKTTNSAKGEVMQYLVKQKNTRTLNYFRPVDEAQIHFLDEVEYLASRVSNSVESAGCIQGNSIYVKVPNHYSEDDEWAIFHTLVHELVHHVSQHTYPELGIADSRSGADYDKLNESITELVTFTILKGHLEKQKTYLKGQKPKKLNEMGYSEYIVIVRQILSKIPMEYFVDAMLNRGGIEALKSKFQEVYDDPEALERYADNLSNAYKTSRERASQAEGLKKRDADEKPAQSQKLGRVIDMEKGRSINKTE